MPQHQPEINQVNSLQKIHCRGLWKFFGDRSGLNEQSIGLRNFSYTFNAGQLYLIQGRNGSGKTTLLSILAGLSSPCEGTCEYSFKHRENELRRPLSWDIATLIGNSGIYEELSIRENLELLWSGCTDAFDLELTRLAKVFSLLENIDRPLKELSLGFRQRANLARLFLKRSHASLPWHVLDEPSVYIDETGLSGLIQQIEFSVSEGSTVILSSHDKELLQALSGVQLFMEKGELRESINET